MLLYGRNWYNIVKQFLSNQEKINEHEHMNIFQKVSKFVHIWKKTIIFDIHLHAVSGVHDMYASLADIINSFAYFFVMFPKWECNLDEGRTFSQSCVPTAWLITDFWKYSLNQWICQLEKKKWVWENTLETARIPVNLCNDNFTFKKQKANLYF